MAFTGIPMPNFYSMIVWSERVDIIIIFINETYYPLVVLR